MKKKDYSDIPKIYGKNVKKMRLLRKLSQEGLSKKSGLHWTYISSVERGERNISLINIYKIAKALNFPLENFLPNV